MIVYLESLLTLKVKLCKCNCGCVRKIVNIHYDRCIYCLIENHFVGKQ